MKKISIINKPTKEELSKIVLDHNSLAEILRYFGLHVGAGNYKTLKNRLKKDNINYSHIKLGLDSNRGKPARNKKDISVYLIKGSLIKSQELKQKLLNDKILENKCSKCNQLPEWNGEKLVLQLDHINGDSSDNRIENLRILCPNCHTQTPTFAGRKLKKHNNCEKCHIAITSLNTLCKKCQPSKRKNKKSFI